MAEFGRLLEGTMYAPSLWSSPRRNIDMATGRILIAAFVTASLLGSSACFSYKKQVTDTPPTSTTVVQPQSPSTTTQSRSSTTTDPYGNTVEKQQSTTTSPVY